MFAKVFRQIFESSIAEAPELRFTFMDLLVLANSDGVVDMTHESIARITNRPLEVIRKTIAELEAPDPRSRTPDSQGRRLQRLDDHRDWGWIIVNYDRFRRIASDDQRRQGTRERVRRFRENRYESKTSEKCNAPVTPCNAGNAMDLPLPLPLDLPFSGKEGVGENPRSKSKGTRDEVMAYFKELGLPESDAEWFFDKCEGNGWRNGHNAIRDWKATVRSWKSAGYLPSQKRGVTARNAPAVNTPAGIQLKSVQKEIDQHPANRESVYYDKRHTEAQRVHLQALRRREAELNSQIAGGGR